MKFDLKLLGKNSIYIEAQSKKCVTEVLSALSRKSPDTLYHSIDFANRIVRLKNIFKLSAEQVSHLYTAALVHDAGKVSIEQELLSRKGMSRMDVLNFISIFKKRSTFQRSIFACASPSRKTEWLRISKWT